MISSLGNHRAARWMSSRANSGRVRCWGSALALVWALRLALAVVWALAVVLALALVGVWGDFPLLFFPLVSPWRLMYSRAAMGKAKTLVGAQKGWTMIRQSTTQSCPQLTRALD